MKNRRFYERLQFAFSGIRSALSTESSFRFQAAAAIGVIGLLLFFRAAPIWWAILLLTIGGVLGAELLNTALEHLIDLVHPEKHPAIKIAKDCAAGAVLVFSLISLGVFGAFLVDIFQ